MDTMPVFLSRQERIERCGADIPSVRFNSWEIGGDYSKKLILKNVTTSTQKWIYTMPKTKYFFLQFPKEIVLSPGMSFVIPVNFRPIVRREYFDYMTFTDAQDPSKAFSLPVTATLPVLALELDTTLIDFGYCPVGERCEQFFTVHNTGQVQVHMDWECPAPFEFFDPNNGNILKNFELPIGDKYHIGVRFTPLCASVLEAHAVGICIGTGHKYTIAIAAASKYSYLSCSNIRSLDFGNTLVGQRVEKKFILTNNTVTWCSFQGHIEHVDSTNIEAGPDDLNASILDDSMPDNDDSFSNDLLEKSKNQTQQVFSFSPRIGVVGPGESVTIRVFYSPKTSGVFSNRDIIFQTPSDKSNNIEGIRVTCSGECIGSIVSCNPNSFEFPDIEPGQQKHTKLTLQNSSAKSVRFQFSNDNNKSIFRFIPSYGVIPPGLHLIVNVKFCPLYPMNYYQRVYCLLEDQSPLSIDLVGTSYSETIRPARLLQSHVNAYHCRNKLYDCRRLSTDVLRLKVNELKKHEINYRDDILTCANTTLKSIISGQYHEYMMEGKRSSAMEEATISPTNIQFGSTQVYDNIDNIKVSRIVTVYNHSKSKMTCIFNNNKNGVFSITPISQDILPNSNVEFIVSFSPQKENFYYGSTLECFISYKINRSFRLVEDDSFCPPISCKLNMQGHTFSPNVEHFLSQAGFSINNLEFPPVLLGKRSHVSFILKNNADTPLAYEFPDNVSDETENILFQVKPQMGVIKKGQLQMFVAEFNSPNHFSMGNYKQSEVFFHQFSCLLNYSKRINIEAKAAVYLAHATLENNGKLFFKPTSIGLKTTRSLTLHNESLIPIGFNWNNNINENNCLAIYPQSGILYGNQKISISFDFLPNAIKLYAFDQYCEIFPVEKIQSNDGKESHYERLASKQNELLTLTVRGRCSAGIVQFSPSNINFGTVPLYQSAHRKFYLTNPSDCSLIFTFRVKVLSIDALPDKIRRRYISSQEDEASLMAGEINSGKKSSRVFTNDDDKEDNSKQILSPLLIFDQFTGSIPAKSQKEIELTLFPTLPLKHHFIVTCQFASSDSASARNHDTNGQIQLEIIANGGFPQVIITDIRYSGPILCQQDSLYKQTSLNNINHELNTPMTQKESRKANKSTSIGTKVATSKDTIFTTKDLLQNLKVFDLSMGINEYGSEPNIYYFKLENTSELPVNWSVRVPDDTDVSLESWAQIGDPDKQTRWHQAIVDRGIFSILPRKGVVKSKEYVIVKILYFHQYLGRHQLPITLQIKNGKQIALRLTGQTVSTLPPVLSFHSFSLLPPISIDEPIPVMKNHILPPDWQYSTPRHYLFKSIPLGLDITQTPVQCVPLQNDSQWDLEYDIDINELLKCKEENYGVNVFCCLNPKGCIKASSISYLYFVFRPFQVKHYSVQIPIRIVDSNIPPQQLIFHGYGVLEWPNEIQPYVGYNDDNKLLYFTHPKISYDYQTFTIPGQICILSHDKLSFGQIPLLSKSHCIVTITNTHNKHYIDFNFEKKEENKISTIFECDKGDVHHNSLQLHSPDWTCEFEPSNGRLEPNESRLIHVTFYANSQCAFVNEEIKCNITIVSPLNDMMKQQEEEEEKKYNNDNTDDDSDTASISSLTFLASDVNGKPKIYASKNEKSELHKRISMRPSVIQSRRPREDPHALEIRRLRNQQTNNEIPIMALSLHERTLKYQEENQRDFRSTSYKQMDRSDADDMLVASMEAMGALDANISATTTDGEPLFQPPNPEDALNDLELLSQHTLSLTLSACILPMNKLTNNDHKQYYIPATCSTFKNNKGTVCASDKNNNNDVVHINKAPLVNQVLDSLMRDIMNNNDVISTFDNLTVRDTPYFNDNIEKSPINDNDNNNNNMNTTRTNNGIALELINNTIQGDILSEFKSLTESIVVSTLFNILNEAANGEFDLNHLPRQVVMEGLKVEDMDSKEEDDEHYNHNHHDSEIEQPINKPLNDPRQNGGLNPFTPNSWSKATGNL